MSATSSAVAPPALRSLTVGRSLSPRKLDYDSAAAIAKDQLMADRVGRYERQEVRDKRGIESRAGAILDRRHGGVDR